MAKLSEILTGPETWCKDTLSMWSEEDKKIRYCIIGAAASIMRGLSIDQISTDADLRYVCDRVALELFSERYDVCFKDKGGQFVRPAAQINDHPDTTFDDVARIIAEVDRRFMLAGGGER